jgi:Mce-associated membrane protein
MRTTAAPKPVDASADRGTDAAGTDVDEFPETAPTTDGGDGADGDHIAADESSAKEAGKHRLQLRMPAHRQALLAGLTMAVALGGLAGVHGWRAYQAHQAAEERALLLQGGRQGALNLTTIDWQHADADVQRILTSATGMFYDDFSKRSTPFVEVLKQTHSRSEGTITAAGLESGSGTQAQVLVALSVKISNSGAPEQHPRAWRMRISVQKIGNDVKMSNVAFVP